MRVFRKLDGQCYYLPIMTPQEFHKRYLAALPKLPPELEIDIEAFEIFDKAQLQNENLHEEDFELLTSIGLP